ncbi:MAG TPA: hypothetical protein VKR53_09025 [Puia sp.]|nr:hypothetical protein [Puia sp.]
MKKLYFVELILFFTNYSLVASEHQHSMDMHTQAPQKKAMDMHATGHEGHSKDMHEHMHGMYGSYSTTREASGTSWVPDSSPQEGFHIMRKDWMLMLNGFSYFVVDNQRGRLGDQKIFDENMFMFMAQTDVDKNTFGFRSMLSAEPITIGKCGYPLLLQTGETCNGKTPLINRQHPHDLFMELALTYSRLFSKHSSAFLYLALPGEPALGPPVYIMRFSSEYIPETPLGHHWIDSTHVTFGVLTAGLIHKNLKFEISGFKGREPNQNRFDIEKPKLDSYSFRLSFNPTENWALQASYGFLKSPEQLRPEVNTKRYVISAIYNKNFDSNNVQAAAIVGVNDDKPGNILPAFLLEATLEMKQKHMFFGRFEYVKKDDLFIEPNPLAGKIFNVKKLTLGYVYEFLTYDHFKWGIGGLFDFPIIPGKIGSCYGDAFSYMFFLQLKLI